MDSETQAQIRSTEPRMTGAQGGKFLGFRLGEEEFGVEILRVREIIGLMRITQVPGAPPHVRGVINLRGKIIPVVDLRAKFGLALIEEVERTCIVVADVVKKGVNVQMGVLVDAVSEVLNIRGEDIEPAPEFGADRSAQYLLGIAKVKGAVKILLNIQDILCGEDASPSAANAA